ncbi:MAG: hypothetical protein HYV36_03005 [Lentisphaerae bacterium]|nr:hypothetical protein [Lentisphaerota bacterium]
MTEPLFQVGAPGVDVERLMAEIQGTVARKTAGGVYRDAQIAQAERHNLANLQDDADFLRYYLDCLRQASAVDINDFQIRERRRLGAEVLVLLKKIIWKLLKFYTYRLWSQQNQVNSLLVTTLEGLEEKYGKRLHDLERRLAALEEEKI